MAELDAPQPEWAAALQERLLAWYGREKRDLPWRHSRDPYHIWVSEAMLQQTRVDTVIPYYERFLAWFPTAGALAAATEDRVLKAWEGLGYYSRARNLQAAAREVATRYGGQVPDDPHAFAALPGVGPYTTGAVLSIAYGRPLPAVDGNVMRVFARLLLLRTDPATPRVRRALEALVAGLIPPAFAGDFNQALMELGALVCLPKGPRCADCPLAGLCRGRAAGEAEALPVKVRRQSATPEVRLALAVVESAEGLLLVRQRPPQGLLADLWEFPNWPMEAAAAVGGEAAEPLGILIAGLAGLGLAVAEPEYLTLVRHAFSHLRWDIQAYRCFLTGPSRPAGRGGWDGAALSELGDAYRWVGLPELAALALPRPMARVAAALATKRGL
ncbi:MAG: A/G-specific adenine glycosylase [Symbiobacteriia bacterium]